MPKGVYKHRSRPPLERFLEKIDRNGPIPAVCPELGPCHPWTAYIRPDGYGEFGVAKGDIILAHRFAWEQAHGPLPPGQQALHRCDNPPCVNETHLFQGTQTDNMQDCVKKRRHVFGARTCTAVLTPDQVREIRVSVGVPHWQLAAQFGVSRRTVDKVVRGETWKYA